ncbi:NAD(P)H-dependent flavin oxidoreductase [Thermomonospora umbrina]|uniref:NAD(P)H-dependent flavin oxidoreductase YrpB (Nitropropane dioxygenase family) n=1 Tax=Thermomonospora umbrina TaxID=111806 RepID=A0A3D9T7P0_9ACTN|nr:nitronate monooxygenase family protein [Thermomonospora umbrina]REE99791.1 NAD(P)H-dependent flavin oxidoreductase YrpB (nitropropane dioxygenase family) [Thermomonospora umbrina]
MRTEVSQMLGIEFPLLAFSHCRDVVAAVTNAGGFGVLGAVAYTPEQLDEELSWIDREVGGRPYGVDVLVPAKLDLEDGGSSGSSGGLDALLAAVPAEHWTFLHDLFVRYGVPLPDLEKAKKAAPKGAGAQVTRQGALDLIDVSLAHPIRLIASALGPPPALMVDRAKEAGVSVAALVGTAEHARRQVAAGVDLIVAQGGEAGGHTGEISTMVLVPEVVDTVAPLPVLAAGGIATGRQMAAAMALGASGVWCGSVWLTTEEAETPPHVKERMLAASSRDTVRSRSRTGKPARQLKSAWTEEWEGPDSPGTLGMPLQLIVAEGAMRQINKVAETGNEGARELANYFVGQCVGLMNTVRPARQVVYDMVEEFAEALDRLNGLSGTG